MKFKSILFLYLLLHGTVLQAQTVNLKFPHFASGNFEFIIFQGNKQIVLKKGIVPSNGELQIVIPSEYENYRGAAQWCVTNDNRKNNLTLIINHENFSATCLNSILTLNNVIFKNSKENRYNKASHKKQQQMLKRFEAVLAIKNASLEINKLYKLAAQEYNCITCQYENYANTLKKSTLYAAQLRIITNLSEGIGTIINADEKVKANNINYFIANEISFEDLYTSSYWLEIIKKWVNLNVDTIKNDKDLINDIKAILKRIKNNTIYSDFVETLTNELVIKGKDNILSEIIPFIKKSRRLEHLNDTLSKYTKEINNQDELKSQTK